MRRLCLSILLLAVGCQQAGISQEAVDKTTAGYKGSRQLKIYREALLNKASSEQIHIDAATELLLSDKPLARKILIEVLEQTENVAARRAVCKALIATRTSTDIVERKEDFIEPLLQMVKEEDSVSAKLAAETTLIFPYARISKQLEKIVTDSSLPAGARVNAIEALKRPDMKAIFKLIDLLDDIDAEVVSAAENVLKSLGIPVVGKDARTREQIRKEIKRKGTDKFLRDWLIWQETIIRTLEGELALWKREYLAALDKIYNGTNDESARGQFLTSQLGSREAIVRLWALGKVEQLRVGTSKLPADLGPILVNMVSDENRDVRLKAANLLSLMGNVNSATKLLEQFEREQDEEVKTELFVALGEACYNAFLPSSKIKIEPEIRSKTLEFAAKYLSASMPKEVQQGAEVIRKLLEQNGLEPAELEKYLSGLAARYTQAEGDSQLRSGLLNAMAGLCAQGVNKDKAAKVFRTLFESALSDKEELVRESAMGGLIYIDKTSALNKFRANGLVSDNSSIIKEKLIELSGDVGVVEDLDWLSESLGTEAQGRAAWRAMLKIFSRGETRAEQMKSWIDRFETPEMQGRLNDEQMVSFLVIAEQKAADEKAEEMLEDIHGRLAELYVKGGDFERGAEYLGLLHKKAKTDEEKEAILGKLLYSYLRWPNVIAAKDLVEHRLLERDLEEGDIVLNTLEEYFSGPPAGADVGAILKAFSQIELPKACPGWAERLKQWRGRFNQAGETDKADAGK
ncbi:MAG: HEAT repeat domain-containing protein [Planctomycetota bacterium]